MSVYPAGNINLENLSVFLGHRELPILYRGFGQINVYIPPDMPQGTHPLTIGLPFFSSIPVPVDVVERWPALADASANEDGTANTPFNPATPLAQTPDKAWRSSP
ncbi:MAG: hypothetical protein HYX27_06890 [Acidobacteria bacterium]|nr:hypothetical protein [Acidobacteriota bacterium]